MQRQVCTAPGWTATRLDGSVCSGIRAHKRFLSDAREATIQRCCWSHAWWWTSTLVTTAPRATGIFIVCSGECPAARLFPNTTCVVCVRLRVLPPNRVTSVCRPSRGVSKGDGRWCGNLGGGQWEEFWGLCAGVNDCHALGVICCVFFNWELVAEFSVLIFVRKECCAKAKGLLWRKSKTTLSCCYVCRINPKSRDLLDKWAQRLTAILPSATRGSSS